MAQSSFHDVLIVGSGHGGAAAAIALRQQGFTGSIGLASKDVDPPYERPPLSKEYLSGEKAFERILIRPVDFWEAREIELLPGQEIVKVDPAGQYVTSASGGNFAYRDLIWATGGSPRRLGCPGHDLPGVHTVRDRSDVSRIMAELPAVRRVVVIGGGYIGLEAAAVLAKAGKQVSVVEALDRVLARVAGEPLSRFFEAEHRAHGVDVRLSATVECIEERQGRVSGVRLGDGAVLAADMVIVGIGIVPNVAPLLEAGAEGGNGVLVDGQVRTSCPNVYAIGDCALHSNRFAGGALVRLESVQNASDQAVVAAKSVIGNDVAYEAVPWFWSNQYAVKLQTIGINLGYDQIVTRGDMGSPGFSLVYLRTGRVIALDCVNAVKDYVQGRALVLGGTRADPGRLADPAIPLKEFATSEPC